MLEGTMDAKKTEHQDKGILNKGFSRRDFLKTTALGAAGLSLSSWAFTPFTYAAEKPIKIGMIQELTVGATEYGYWLSKVGKAAVAKLNAEGGIAGRKVELIEYDTKFNPAYGAQMFKKLVLEDKVDFIMGSIHSGIQLACFPIAEQFKIPYFGGGAMASALTGKGAIPYYIRIHTHALMQAMAGWEWAFKNLGKKWAFVVADYAWGHSLEEEFGKRVKAAGGKVQEIRAPQTTKDFVPFLQKIDPDIDVLFTAFLNPAALGVMRQIRGTGPPEEDETLIRSSAVPRVSARRWSVKNRPGPTIRILIPAISTRSPKNCTPMKCPTERPAG